MDIIIMITIKSIFMFLGVMLVTTIGFQLFFHGIQFLYDGTFKLDRPTSEATLFISAMAGLIAAIYYLIEED